MTEEELIAEQNDPIYQKHVVEQNAMQEIENENSRNVAYLHRTDWYITRQAETGKPIPDDVSAKRQAARESITGE